MRWTLVACVGLLFLGCKGRTGEGERCGKDSVCAGDLTCQNGRCRINPALHQKMARQSGVAVSGERASAGGPGAVRIRKATGRGFAFAVCGDDERLVGGWCSPLSTGGGDNTAVVKQSAGGYTASDTVGAQWKCEFLRTEVTAFAMCQKVLATPASSAVVTPLAAPMNTGPPKASTETTPR